MMHGGKSTGHAQKQVNVDQQLRTQLWAGRHVRRTKYSKGVRKLYELEMLRRKIGMISGPMVGRKPTGKS
jgi:hypothetical protein